MKVLQPERSLPLKSGAPAFGGAELRADYHGDDEKGAGVAHPV